MIYKYINIGLGFIFSHTFDKNIRGTHGAGSEEYRRFPGIFLRSYGINTVTGEFLNIPNPIQGHIACKRASRHNSIINSINSITYTRYRPPYFRRQEC